MLLWIGINVTIYYRRKFDWTNCATPLLERLVELCSILTCVPNRVYEVDAAAAWKVGIVLAFVLVRTISRLKSREETAKSVAVAGSFQLVASEAGSVPVLTWIATCGMAATQLLRWPPAVKDRLRTLRTICGPIYTILVVGACLKENPNGAPSMGFDSGGTTCLRSPTLLELAAVSSSIGSVLFRPDNASIWSLLSWVWNGAAKSLGAAAWSPSQDFARTKGIHACLMVVSFLCMVIKFLRIDYGASARSIGILLIALSSSGLACGTTLWKSRWLVLVH